MKPLEIGEIGVLQNLSNPNAKYNGMLAEVIGFFYNKWFSEGRFSGYKIKDILGDEWHIETDKIRRITDPDQEQTTEHDEVVVV